MNYKSIFRHYWRFIKKRSFSQIGILFVYAGAMLFVSGLVPLIYKEIIDIVTNGIDSKFSIEIVLIGLTLSIIIYNIFFRIGDYLVAKSQSLILKDLSDYTLEKLKDHSYKFFSDSFGGALIAKTKRFLGAFETLHDLFIFHIWMNGLSLILSVTVLMYQSKTLGIVFIIWLALYAVLTKLLIKWQVPKSLKYAEADSLTTARYSDIITNIFTVKMFGTEKRELNEYKEVTKDQESKRSDAWLQQAFWNNMWQGLSVSFFEIAIMWFAIVLWQRGIITPGVIVLTQIYVFKTFGIVWGLSKYMVRMSTALSDANEMVEIFDKYPDVRDAVKAKELKPARGNVEFKDVTFAYNKTNLVFNKLNFSIKPGEKVALVGHSGAGKTTIVKLLLRFIDLQGGSIQIDGQDISKVTQQSLRQNIAYVPQDPSLFHRSLRENIAYIKPNATMEEVIAVSKRANADEFINDLPEKYESLVGERGVKLSGGERQRIAIARAMLKDAPIIVLDEATSALDSISEQKIQLAFKELMKDKTTIVIAHRLSTIKNMDRIVVFDEGSIVEIGTHNELIENNGTYAKLWNSQVGGFIAE